MFKEVVEIIGKKENKVKVKFKRTSVCSHCKLNFLCSRDSQFIVDDDPSLDLRVGDKIEVGMEEKKSLLVSLIMFFVPALIFIFTLFFFRGQSPFKSFFIAIVFLGLYYLILRIFVIRLTSSFNLKIIRKI